MTLVQGTKSEGKLITASDKYAIDGGALTIDVLSDADAGPYACFADNAVDRVPAQTQLSVFRESPSPPIPRSGTWKEESTKVGPGFGFIPQVWRDQTGEQESEVASQAVANNRMRSQRQPTHLTFHCEVERPYRWMRRQYATSRDGSYSSPQM